MPFLDRTGWTATADSSFETHLPALMLDGNTGTYWQSTGVPGYPHFVVLDLGAECTFDTVSIRGSSSFFPTTIEFYVSDDGVTWGSPVVTATPAFNNPTSVMLPRQTTRYLKILFVSSTGGNTSVIISELNLWVEQGLNRFAWLATSDSHYSDDTDASKAIDGNNAEDFTNFISDAGAPQSITVDMGSVQTINYIRVAASWSRFYVPITWGQTLPTRVQAWTSLDNVTWVLAREMVWPEYGSPHWIEFTSRSARYFRFTATRIGGGYNRLAIAEIWAGQLAAGETYKDYWIAHPTTLNIHQSLEYGSVDYLNLVPDPSSPADLQLAKVEAKMRLWKHRPLAGDYPEIACSVWNLPAQFEDLTLESVSPVVEGQLLQPDGFTGALSFFLKNPLAYGGQGTPGADDWAGPIQGDIFPQVQELWYDPAVGWRHSLTQATLADYFVTAIHWGSTTSDAISHDDEDTSRFLMTDLYLLVVWERPYVLPVITDIDGWVPPGVILTGHPPGVSNRGSCILFPAPSIVPDLTAVREPLEN